MPPETPLIDIGDDTDELNSQVLALHAWFKSQGINTSRALIVMAQVIALAGAAVYEEDRREYIDRLWGSPRSP